MKIKPQVIVFDAADIGAESAFWAAVLGGTVVAHDDWHSVIVDGEWHSVCSSRRTTLLPTGPMARRNRCTSISRSTISARPTKR